MSFFNQESSLSLEKKKSFYVFGVQQSPIESFTTKSSSLSKYGIQVFRREKEVFLNWKIPSFIEENPCLSLKKKSSLSLQKIQVFRLKKNQSLSELSPQFEASLSRQVFHHTSLSS